MAEKTGYDDEGNLSDDDKRALAEIDQATAAPPAEDGAIVGEQAGGGEAAPAAPAPPAPPAPASPPADGAAPAPADEAAERAAFMEKHKGKSPEELLELLHQQTQRAGREGFRARKSAEQLEQITTRARTALEQRRADIASRRAAFDALLKDDPDGAAKQLHDKILQDELSEAERQAEDDEHSARVDAALELAAAAIPDFAKNIQPTLGFGREMGYSPQEIAGISDGRDIVTLYLASKFADLVKAGICDVRGQFLKAPQPVNEQPVDPRLNTPAPPTTLSSEAARSGGGGQTAEQQLAAMLAMSDEDFAKQDPAVLEALIGGSS